MVGQGLGLVPMQPEKVLGAWPGRVMFKCRAGPLLRMYRRGEAARPKEGLQSVEFWGLEARPWVRVCGCSLGPAHWRGSLSVEVGPWVGV